MPSPVELAMVHYGIYRATVNMSFDNSVEARNFLARIGHLVEYDGQNSQQIVFRIDEQSIRQAAEWGLQYRPIWAELRRFYSGRWMPGGLHTQFFKTTWRKTKPNGKPGVYSRWLSMQGGHQFYSHLRLIQSLWVLKSFDYRLNSRSLPQNVKSGICDRGEKLNELLINAGYDPETECKLIRGQHKTLAKRSSPRPEPLSRMEVLREILLRRARGQTLIARQVLKQDSLLYHGANNHFGHWRKAIAATGIDPDEVLYHVFTPRKMLRQLREIKSRGEPIGSRYLARNYQPLHNALVRRYGSWESAAKAAGFVPSEEWTRGQPWSRKRVIGELKRLKGSGEPINPQYIHDNYPNTYYGMRHCFGTWVKAVEAAGFDPVKESLRSSHLKGRRKSDGSGQ